MPITTTIRIIITLAGQVDQPAPSSPYLFVNRTIHLRELPSANAGAFVLRLSEGTSTKERQLSAVDSKQLTTLLTQLPSHSMASDGMSFDGLTYELIVMQAEQPLSFYWRNDDWRYAPQSPLDKWERVAAVADYALKLAEATP